jgi:hypothetical protein
MPTVEHEGISFAFDRAIAADVMAELAPAADVGGLGWSIEPTHVRFTFDDYVLPDTLHQPRIVVYPVDEYEAISEHGAKTIVDLRQLLVDRPAAPEAIPFLPPLNAGQLIRAQVAYIDFQDGTGVRFLTQYAQTYLPINNRELFYTFQGLADDGNAYVAAILPVSHPILPPDFMAYEGHLGTLARTYETYIAAVRDQFDEQDASSYTPDLSQLDAMIQSLEVSSSWSPAVPPATEGRDGPYPGWAEYVNTDYGFAFRYPTAWTLRGRANLIKLSQGTLLLTIAYRRQGEEIPYWPWMGMPAGDFEGRGTMVFLGQEIEKTALVFEGKVKGLTYTAEVGDLLFAIGLDDRTAADYRTIEIPEAAQSKADQIVGSFEICGQSTATDPTEQARGSQMSHMTIEMCHRTVTRCSSTVTLLPHGRNAHAVP